MNIRKDYVTSDRWKLADIRGISRRLNLTLDAIGFSEKSRLTLSNNTVLVDINNNIHQAFTNSIHCFVTLGSQREGTTNLWLESDRDVLFFSPFLNVFETIQEKTNCQLNTHFVTVKDPHTPNGYTKLQLVQNKKIVCSEDEICGNELNEIHLFEKFKYDKNGRLVLSNEFIPYNNLPIHSRNGPASTVYHKGQKPSDCVRSYMFNDIPKVILPWFSRARKQDWPSRETLELCRRMGCFVVPVGQADSKERNLEWRYSMSFQERYLMLNLNESQYKCYIVLKLIKKFLIKPRCGDVLSSYHFKTSLFYTIEQYGNETWTTESTLNNVIKCLEVLLQWVQNRNCPNFFIKDENMFLAKLNKNAYHLLETYVKTLIRSNCIDLLQIQFRNFGTILSSDIDLSKRISFSEELTRTNCAAETHSSLFVVCKRGISKEYVFLLKLITNRIRPPQKYVNWFKEMELENRLMCGMLFSNISKPEHLQTIAKYNLVKAIKYIELCYSLIYNNKCDTKLIPIELAMRFIFDSMCSFNQLQYLKHVLKNSYQIYFNFHHEKQLICEGLKLARAKIFTDLANIFVAEYVRTASSSRSVPSLLESITYFEIGKSVNFVTNRLKCARLLYIRHMYSQCHALLNALVIKEKETMHTCICYEGVIVDGNQTMLSKINRLSKQRVLSSKCNKRVDNFEINNMVKLIANDFTNCVIYDFYELDATSVPLVYEAFRSFGTPRDLIYDESDYWFDRVVLDPVVYLHYMLIECCYKLNNRAASAASLGCLENLLFITCDNSLRHKETALNIIGHMYIKKGWTKLANECFRKSLNIRPLHNAPKWHIMFLLFG